MKDFEYAYDVLLKVVNDGVPFNMAIQATIEKGNKNNPDPKLKSMLFAVCGCVLRHYYIFKEVISRQYNNIKENDFLLISLGIGNKLFAKRIDQEKLEKYIAKKTGLQGAPVFIECFQDPKNLIPEDIQYGTEQYYSLRYNIPLWVVRLWKRDGGELLSRKIFYSVTNRPDNLLRINEDVIETDDFFEKYNDFVPLGERKGIAQYVRDGSPKKHRAIQEGDALRIPLSYRYMCEGLELNQDEGIAIYGCGTNHLLEELFVRLGKDFKATYICGHTGHSLEIKDCLAQYGLTNVKLIDCENLEIDKCLENKVKTFFVCPRSSFLLGLYERADHFLRLDEKDLNKLQETELNDLEAASKFVKKDGELVYFVTTFCHQEGNKVKEKFLTKHPEYSLVKDKQLYPFDKYQTMLYFAVFKKNN